MRRFVLAVATAALLTAPALAGPNEDALMAADKAFNDAAQKEGAAKAFAEFAAPDARMFHGQADIVQGPQAVQQLLASGDDGSKMTWSPSEAVASADGTMGFTRGRWTETSKPDAQGKSDTEQGSYVTIWAKQPDGSWKWSLDMGDPDDAADTDTDTDTDDGPAQPPTPDLSKPN